MFNAAFLTEPVSTREELRERIRTAQRHFDGRQLSWSFWFGEHLLDDKVRRHLVRDCAEAGMRIAAEMPGMYAAALAPPKKQLPELDIQVVNSGRTLEHFRQIGSACFRVPPDWFAEVFDGDPARSDFVCRVGYLAGKPVATSASVLHDGTLGIYNVATVPEHRGKGVAEAMTRHAANRQPVVLQSTAAGVGLYESLGFRAVTKIVVFNSQ